MRGTFFRIAALCVSFVSVFVFWASAHAATDVKGFAWSSNIGWISFNSANCDANLDGKSDGTNAACPSAGTDMGLYGITLSALPTGNFAGFAWSSNIGWISFNTSDLTGCPSGSCTSGLMNNAAAGWARAIGGNTAGTSGWTGWLHLANATPAYGPLLGADGKFAGYSWGQNVVGWMKWNPAGGGVYIGVVPPTTPTTTPSAGTLLQVIENGSGLVVSNVPTPNGINCGSDCSERYASSTSVVLVASNTTGYQFDSWGGDASSCGSATTCTLLIGNATTTALANFNPILQVTKVGNGTITSQPSGINCGSSCAHAYVFGTIVTLTATPDSGYQFSGWGGSAASCGTNITCSVAVSGYTSVTATFSLINSNQGTLIVAPPTNGSVVSDDGKIACGATCQASYDNGTSVMLQAVPEISGGVVYTVGSWGGAASSCGSNTTCSVTVSGTTDVSVTFVAIPQCSDGIDNDTDGKTDAADPGCHTDNNAANAASYDPNDNDETDAFVPICSDGIDNNGDGTCDYGAPGTTKLCVNALTGVASQMPPDPNCSSSIDMTEQPSYRCSDHIDNDGDGKCDYNGGLCLDPYGTTCGAVGAICQMPPDFPDCNSPYKNSETVNGSVIEY